jgi:hypothetical protein
MTTEKNNRVLNRRGARDLTAEEQATVSAGAGTFIRTGTFREALDVIRD